MRKIIMLVTILLIVITLSACNKSLCDSENCVYVTVYPMQYLVEQIAGDYVDVARVPGSQVHSESIDWSAKEIIDMKNADILFYINGSNIFRLVYPISDYFKKFFFFKWF